MNDFRNRLTESATSFEVTPVDSEVIARQSRRRATRATVARVAVVAVAIGAGAIGVRQLSSETISTEMSPASDADSATTASASTPGSAAPDPTGAAYPPGTVPPFDFDMTEAEYRDWFEQERERFAALPEVSDAEFVDPTYRWTAYDADSPQAAAVRFDPSDDYAVGSADGEAGWGPFLYKRSGDGWTELTDLGAGNSWVRVGDAVYIAPSDDAFFDPLVDRPKPGEFKIRRADLNTGEVTDVALPPDFDDEPTPVSERLRADRYSSIGASGDSLIVERHYVWSIDPSVLGLSADWIIDYNDYRDYVDYADEEMLAEATGESVLEEPALTTAYNEACEMQIFGEIYEDDVSRGETPGTLATAEDLAVAESLRDCHREFTSEDIQLTEDERRTLGTGVSKIWSYTGDAWVPIDASIGETLAGTGSSHRFGDWATAPNSMVTCHTLDTDGSPIRLYAEALFDPWHLENCGAANDGKATLSYADFILQQDVGSDTWRGSNLDGIGAALGLGNSSILEYIGGGYPASADGVYIAGLLTPSTNDDTVLTSGDYTLTLPVDPRGAATLVNNVTGATHRSLDDMYLSTETGKITAEVNSDEGPPYATTAPRTTAPSDGPSGDDSNTDDPNGDDPGVVDSVSFDGDWQTIDYLNPKRTTAIIVPRGIGQFELVDVRKVLQASGLEHDQISWDNTWSVGDQMLVSLFVGDDVNSEAGVSEIVLVGTPE